MPKVIADIRERILQKGKEMLLQGDYADFNLRNLAKSCELGLGTFYNYFANKEDLAYHIFKNDWTLTIGLVESIDSSIIPLEQMLKSLYFSLETFIGRYMRIFREMSEGGAKKCPHDYYSDLSGQMTLLVEEYKKTGEIKSQIPSDKLAWFIMTSMFNCIRSGMLSFDDMYKCLRL